MIGATSNGTRVLRASLDRHPQITMAPREVNFFFGPGDRAGQGADGVPVLGVPAARPGAAWRTGHWPKGPEWYVRQFAPDARVRGDVSPGYTDPSRPEVAERMAALVPEARLVYLVRDPVVRAVSQWEHRVRMGAEHRSVEESVLDAGSGYLTRSRYHERLLPFLRRYRRDQVLVVVQERLLADRPGQLRRVFRHVGVDADWWDPGHRGTARRGPAPGRVSERLRGGVWDAVGEDVSRLREVMGDPLPEWSRPRTTSSARSGGRGGDRSTPAEAVEA